MLKQVLRGSALLLFVVFGGMAIVACNTRTSGVKLKFQAKATGRLINDKPVTSFENRHQWKITLTQAHMLVGPFYLMEGEPQVRLWDYLRPWGIAHAHVVSGGQRVLAELREHFVLDLLKPAPTSLGAIRGIAGLAQTAELHLLPPGGTRLSKNSMPISHVNHATVYALGSATKGDQTRPFQLALTINKSKPSQTVSNISVEIPLEEKRVEEGYLLLQVYVDRWLTNVDFARLTQKDERGRFVLNATNQSILQGIRSRYSYNFSWRKK